MGRTIPMIEPERIINPSSTTGTINMYMLKFKIIANLT